MTKGARVESLEVFRQLRSALVKFAETANTAMGDAESEMQRLQMWVENEQSTHWQGQLRKRQAALVKAKEALRQKQIFKDVTGARQSYVDEEKAVASAMRQVQEAELKLINVKRWTRQLEKEINLYKGSVQRFSTSVNVDVPGAVAKLDRLAATLQGYLAVAPENVVSTAEGSDQTATMSRPEPALPSAGEAYLALRRLSPAPRERERIEQGGAPAIGQSPAVELSRLARLNLPHEALDPNATFTFASGLPGARRVYLDRVASAFPGDSGWHIGLADDSPAGEHRAARVGDLIANSPAINELLQLSPGTLIVLDGAGIAALFDSQNENLWAETNPASDENEAAAPDSPEQAKNSISEI
ncbi:MAG TPA: hypothetical protein VFW23_17410 [Tepidisphaeraceae bacterium]|nr:hypothetical protein [Tepidisphaeraceae bacterium]